MPSTLIALIALAVVALLVWTVEKRRRAVDPPEEIIELSDPLPEEEPEGEPEPPIDRLAVQLSFQQRYREMSSRISIPSGARYADKIIDVFSLKNVPVTHFCWKADGAIHTFPVWESVENLLVHTDHWVLLYAPGDENNLSKLTLPIAKILSYSLSPATGEVVLRHLNFAGNETVSVFCGPQSAETFAKLIPEKQLAFVQRKLYLSSSQNISDLKSEIGGLRDQLLRGVITKEEYDRLKIACVLRM